MHIVTPDGARGAGPGGAHILRIQHTYIQMGKAMTRETLAREERKRLEIEREAELKHLEDQRMVAETEAMLQAYREAYVMQASSHEETHGETKARTTLLKKQNPSPYPNANPNPNDPNLGESRAAQEAEDHRRRRAESEHGGGKSVMYKFLLAAQEELRARSGFRQPRMHTGMHACMHTCTGYELQARARRLQAGGGAPSQRSAALKPRATYAHMHTCTHAHMHVHMHAHMHTHTEMRI